jgi:3-oxoacyl-[acyl-carrier protein] reductase
MAANIIVNGGTKGIGAAVARLLALDSSNKIIVTGRSSEHLSRLEKEHSNIKTYTLDITCYKSEKENFIKFVLSYFDVVNVLINTVGFLKAKDFMETTVEEARLTLETNLTGPAMIIQSLKPMMASGSHIVNISSMGGFQGSVKFRGLSWYSASKAAVICLTECLANELSTDHISVNCLALGAVQTEMLGEAFPGYKAPLEAAEMAEYIANFALTGNKFFNGKVLPVAVSTP